MFNPKQSMLTTLCCSLNTIRKLDENAPNQHIVFSYTKFARHSSFYRVFLVSKYWWLEPLKTGQLTDQSVLPVPDWWAGRIFLNDFILNLKKNVNNIYSSCWVSSKCLLK